MFVLNQVQILAFFKFRLRAKGDRIHNCGKISIFTLIPRPYLAIQVAAAGSAPYGQVAAAGSAPYSHPARISCD